VFVGNVGFVVYAIRYAVGYISDCAVQSFQYFGNLTAVLDENRSCKRKPQLGAANHSKRAKRAQLQ
jgi:hypothetical protein